MFDQKGVTRRAFLGSSVLFALAATCAARPALGMPAAPGASGAAAKPHPPGTCGRWTDLKGNGICDRSEEGDKPCRNVNCPGNKNNAKRDTLRAKGAPANTCAQWDDTAKAGYCSVTCNWVACPANKNAAGAAAKKTA